jgi:hypothetical protein
VSTVVVGVIGLAQDASAATPVYEPGTNTVANAIQTLTLITPPDTYTTGDTVKLDGTWEVPAGTPAGATFSMTLPAELTCL